MIYSYGITSQGTYHIKSNLVCQDAHAILRYDDNCIVAAVADGLGSELYSDVASATAVKVATEYCMTHLSESSNTEEMLDIIKASFAVAFAAIQAAAKMQGNSLDQYDTTLTLAIFTNDELYYGHSGDSGIVVLTVDGLYRKVTEQQRDEDSHVFPLCCQDRWVIKKFESKVASAFLATDGMLETLFPFLIKDAPVSIHIALARFFMDNHLMQIDIEGEKAVQARMEDFIKSIPDEQVNDDKTIVVLINTSTDVAVQPAEYYIEPDWIKLKQAYDCEWKRIAYPHLFGGKNTVSEQE